MIKKSKKNGFTLIECLVALLCDFVVMALVLVFLNACVHILHIRTMQQDQIAILQLRQMLATATDIEVSENYINLIYEHEQIRIGYDRNRIVRTPGYEILMENVEQTEFYEKNQKIYISYQKEQGTYTYQLY